MEHLVKVLLIDDDEDDYILTRDLLEEVKHAEYQLDWASSYREGVQAIRHQAHDVCLIDYQLGAYTGLDVIETAVNDGIEAPLILLTGQGDREVDEMAMKKGASDYLYKGSLNRHNLERAIRYSMEHAKNIKEIRKLNSELEQRVLERTRELAHAIKQLERSNENLQDQIKERRAVEKALKESQGLYTAIAENFPDGVIIVLNKSLKFEFIDGKELEELGLKKSQFLNKTLIEALSDSFTKKAEEKLHEVLNGAEENFDVKYQQRYYNVSAVPLKDIWGDIDRIMIVGKNITQQKIAEQEIRKSLEKEKELSELKSRFVSMASHEFRTPLSTIMSSVSLIEKYTSEEQQDKRQKHVNRIKSSVNNLTGILNDFLSLSKLEEGKTATNPVDIDLHPFVESVVEDMQAVAKDKQQVHFKHEGAVQHIYLDPQMLKNVLYNLLSNAIKYSPEGSLVRLETSFQEDYLMIKVKDQGIGIPDDEQMHMFERFFRARNVTNIQGTGLGLNIVKKYVELLNGSIMFQSKPDVGTTFTVTIPREMRG